MNMDLTQYFSVVEVEKPKKRVRRTKQEIEDDKWVTCPDCGMKIHKESGSTIRTKKV